MNSQLVLLDTTDDRRELWRLIHRLPPKVRLEFLQDCCGRVPATHKRHRLPVPAIWKMRVTMEQAYRCDKADEMLSNEVYMDIIQLFNIYELDAVATAKRLESIVRRLRV